MNEFALSATLVYVCHYLCRYYEKNKGRRYVLLSEIRECIADLVQQIQLDHDEKVLLKKEGRRLPSEERSKYHNAFGTCPLHVYMCSRMRVMPMPSRRVEET